MHGLGNCYIYVNMFEEKIEEERLKSLAIEVANVNIGIGADGMILICPSEVAPVKMRVFNNDGSEAKNCGNGLRCVAKYAYENKLVDNKVFKIETLGGLVQAEVHLNEAGLVDLVTVDMGQPRLQRKDLPMLGEGETMVVNEPFQLEQEALTITGVSMGNPHAIIFVDDIDQSPVETVGPKIEKHEKFPEWVNVEFVEVVSETELHFRVWERGTGITQACGTGACAAVVASVLNNHSSKGREVTVHLLGGDLTINWAEAGNVFMTGPATTICVGEYIGV
ncbi:diaminopimelate epimerase [Anaerobacillus alkalidiazotrophicus]|uniref:Diaminopimelate epimerase n=1 Tax=Anaerobacillus alkalidiazotrophicus TaxID=472963 RepID=A0A1S2MAU4_9BACI|nr:diaminopimelate epimerase [Anaerobacillus alkalidiazotrophicus]OIJ20947.1 diaminopimelate epimerase [Anaerobacillus alkalidiazotrophicus]